MAVFSFDDFTEFGGLRHELNGDTLSAPGIGLDDFTVSNRFGISDPTAPTVTIQGFIDIVNDVDVYRFEILPGDAGFVTLTFDIDGASGYGLDSQIQLFGPDRFFIQDNDDYSNLDAGSDSSLDSFMTYTPTLAGYYYIAVTSYNNDWWVGGASGGNSRGFYDLHVSVSGSVGVQTYDSQGSFGDDSMYGDYQGDVRDDTLQAYAGNDYLYGFDGNDRLFGGDGNDTLFGGAGNDNLYGGDGDDRYDGGPGSDYYDFTTPTSGGIDTFVIRYLESTPSAADYFSVRPGLSSFDGAGVAGGDIIELAGFTGPVFWHGLWGGGLGPVGAGNGVIDAIFGHNFNSQGFIDETYLFLDADDSGSISANDLFVVFETQLSFIPGDFAAGQVVGPAQSGPLAEIISGTAAPDYILAGGGGDTVSGGGGVDLLMGETGADKLYGEAGNDSLDGGTENDRVDGGTGNDYLFGGDGSDKLIGGAGTDRLNGGLGNDVLTGGAGRDILTGNGGADRYDFNALAETGITGTTRDSIIGFVHGVDKIDLSTIDAITGGGAANDSFLFAGPFTAGHVRAIQSVLNTIVQLNTDADAAPEATILLLNFTASTLTAGDFIL